MLDIKEIRTNPDRLREAISLRNVDPKKADLDRWLKLEDRRRQLRSELDGINTEKNKLSNLGRTDPEAARVVGQQLREKSREIEIELNQLLKDWQSILDWFPNWPHPDMPRGTGEEQNIVFKAWVPRIGYLDATQMGNYKDTARLMPQAPIHAEGQVFNARDHVKLGELLGGIDVLQGAKVSGSRFAYILGDLAILQLAIQRLLIDKLLSKGYQPIIPPLLVRERSLYGTSHFPEARDQVYAIQPNNVEESGQLFLVGSSEPANFSYFMDKVLKEIDLPIKVFASTPCFRSEAGSWGKDVRGIKRVHQFDKIEMNSVCTSEQAEEIYKEFCEINEWLLQTLELPYRLVDKCTGDAGYLASHRQMDVEVWLSGSGEFLETMTNTNASEYQARRLNIRYKSTKKDMQFCCTLNDTGCALGRMLIAILDNYQQSDGSIKVPRALQPFVGKESIVPKANYICE